MDEGRKCVEDWEKATEGKRTARRGFLCQDRNDPDSYLNIVFFDSYEAAMENSKLPETQELAEKLAALTDGPPTFNDLDLVEERFEGETPAATRGPADVVASSRTRTSPSVCCVTSRERTKDSPPTVRG